MATICIEQLLNLWSGYATAWSLGLAGLDFTAEREERARAADEVPQKYKDRNGVWGYVDTELERGASYSSRSSEELAPTEKDDADSYVSIASGNGSRRGRVVSSSEEPTW